MTELILLPLAIIISLIPSGIGFVIAQKEWKKITSQVSESGGIK